MIISLEKRDLSQRNSRLSRLGFLVHESYFDDLEVLYALGQELGLQRENVEILTFSESRKKVEDSTKKQITKNDFSWRGEILAKDAEDFLNVPFDVIIGIYEKKHGFLDVLVSKSSAKFKMGFYGADPRLYDLLLDINPKNIEALKVTTKTYLKIFNKI